MNIIDRIRGAWMRRQQDRQIRRHGWTGVYVGDYRRAPTWAYTIGFDEALDHPELWSSTRSARTPQPFSGRPSTRSAAEP